MDIISDLKEMLFDAGGFVNTNNYYFENHACTKTGQNIKVQMDLTIRHDKTNNIVKLGQCPQCKTVFYHEDYESRSI